MAAPVSTDLDGRSELPGTGGWHGGPDHPSFVPASLLPAPVRVTADGEGAAADASGSGIGIGIGIGIGHRDRDRRWWWAGWQRVPRSGRDWVVDVTVFVLSAGLGALFFVSTCQLAPRPLSSTVLVVDVVLGVLASLALWLRRRWPVGLALALLPAVVLSSSAAIATLVALFTVAVHRRLGLLMPITAAYLAAAVGYTVYRPDKATGFVEMNIYNVVLTSAIVAWGMFVRARQQLVLSLRERAERAEATQRILAEQARSAERARIAREMHDVLAHRITMVALQAGALEMRPGLPSDQVGATAGLIRSAARQALEELREVVGVLRSDPADDIDAPRAPQPTLADLEDLVADARRAGMAVEASIDLVAVQEAPGALGRDAYRIVQEALTNVGKHARGAAATVRLDGRPGDGLRVVVRNRLPVAVLPGADPDPGLPGSGSGLTGLAERVALSGGTLLCGPNGAGEFVVDAHLRWPA